MHEGAERVARSAARYETLLYGRRSRGSTNRKVEQYYIVQEYGFRVEREKKESKPRNEAQGISEFQTIVSKGRSLVPALAQRRRDVAALAVGQFQGGGSEQRQGRPAGDPGPGGDTPAEGGTAPQRQGDAATSGPALPDGRRSPWPTSRTSWRTPWRRDGRSRLAARQQARPPSPRRGGSACRTNNIKRTRSHAYPGGGGG